MSNVPLSPAEYDRCLPELSGRERIVALSEDSDGRWHCLIAGRVVPLSDEDRNKISLGLYSPAPIRARAGVAGAGWSPRAAIEDAGENSRLPVED